MPLRLLLALCVLMLLVPATADAKQLSCRSGHGAFTEGRTRIFFSARNGGSWYVCSARLRHPHRFVAQEAYSSDHLTGFRSFGDRVAFVWEWSDGDEGGYQAGWVDLHTGERRDVGISCCDGASDPPPGLMQGVAARDDGAIAFVEQTNGGGQLIVYARNGLKRLGRPRGVVRIDAADPVVPSSLGLADGVITWTTRSGAAGSAAVNAHATSAARAATVGCHSGQTRFQDGRTRIFRTHTGRWYLCSAEVRRPRMFAGENGGRKDSLHAFRRFGERVAFAWYETTSDEGGWLAAWIDVRTAEVRLTGVTGQRLEAVAADADGAIAYVARDREWQQIGYARNGVHALGSARVLASVMDIVPGSLALAGGMVTWKSSTGAPGSAPIR